MLKKLSSIVLIGFLAFSVTACAKKETLPAVTDKENIGINVQVNDKAPVEDKENVGVNVEVKEGTPAPTN